MRFYRALLRLYPESFRTVGLGYLAGRAMQALLVGVRPGDPLTMVAAVVVCFATVILGCVRAAARASRVDPMSALRPE